MTKFNAPPKGGGAGTALSQKFAQGLLKSFEATGQKAIDDLAEQNPVQYLRFVSAIAPDGQGTGPLTDITDDELAAFLDYLRTAVGAEPAAAGRGDSPQGQEPPEALHALRAPEAVP
ncbi:MAG: hypothetical protein ACK6DM_07115 [Alphaproteobacteria bacterium]